MGRGKLTEVTLSSRGSAGLLFRKTVRERRRQLYSWRGCFGHFRIREQNRDREVPLQRC